MTKAELKVSYRGYGKVFAHSLKDNDNYPERWALCLERVNRFLTSLPESDIDLKESLIDAFMIGAGMTFNKEMHTTDNDEM